MHKKTTVYRLLGLQPGALEINHIQQSRWGGAVNVLCTYNYPPEQRPFTLRFTRVRSIQWIVINPDAPDTAETQVLTHDLGLGNYQRTARFASTLAEVIISYEKLEIIEGHISDA